MITDAMVTAPFIEELRLTAFKSFRDAVLPMRDLTLLIGRNGSGKSNAIDGLHVLARLAEGEDIREAIDGSRRDGSEVRGGVRGCAPYGDSSFKLGCTVVDGADRLCLDLEIQVEPDVQIIYEELHFRPATGKQRPYLATDPVQPGLVDVQGRYFNGKRGLNPGVAFRSDRLLTAQVPTKVPATLKATRDVHQAAAMMIEALRSVFILDPVPAMMRQYVQRRDATLRRQADNLSAVIGALQQDATRWERLKELVQALPEQEVAKIAVETYSPAMLTALPASDHDGVLVCRRDPASSLSELVRLVDLPRYPEALAAGSLGDAVTQRRLDGGERTGERLAALDELLATI